jgi:hypothetical protein
MKRLVFVLLAFLILLFIFFFLPVVWGQSIDGERKLSKIPSHPLFDGLGCGEYFVVVSNDEERPQIGFIFEIEPMVLEEQAFLLEEIFVIREKKKPIPTIRFTHGGKIKVILKVSEKEFRKSPCLQRCLDTNRT